ncbi:MAG: hypothetical protein J3Q66DRAFT_355886 [Benniella sp.]|nr:MAG: hypothetical protein J3Q66DRAFT_355886 [Benniella sp.]
MTVREGLRIEISGIPAENGKCRVETQLKITLHLKGAAGEAIKDWKQLRLPHPLIAKEKHRMEKFNGRNKHIQDAEILTLEAKLVCDHDRTKVLVCCDSCIGRERKRAHRRKESQKLPGPLSSIAIFGSVNPKHGTTSLANEPVPPTPTDPVEYEDWERRRIMVFSSTEYVDISSGQCLLPTRITCYCRHHNEKVGFRIQFTAKDSTGAVIASVLTNPVMMMDDHKSGKRVASALSKNGAATSSSSTKQPTGTSTIESSKSTNGDSQAHQLDSEDEQDDMDQDEGAAEDQDEIDLEAGRHLLQHGFTGNGSKFEDSEMLSGDILTPLVSSMDRTGMKRRVDDNMMDDVHTQSSDYSRGPFRRKTSHDITSASAPMPSLFAPSPLSFGSSSTLPTQSPFMPGSPFANDEQGNTFIPSFSQSMLGDESFLDQKNINMFLQANLSTLPSSRRNDLFNQGLTKDLTDQDSSMMEFTTLEETITSAPEDVRKPSLTTDTPSTKQEQDHDRSSISNTSQTFTMPATTVPAPDYSALSAIPSVEPNPFSIAGMLSSAFSTTFSAPLNGVIPTVPTTTTSGMTSSFLDASQIQEFQAFKRQSALQQQQQDVLMQLQQGLQQPGQQATEAKPVPWTTDSKDPFFNMKSAMAQTTNPLSSAFIPDSTALSENATGDAATDFDGNEETSVDTPFAPKKRGRPRKTTLPTASESSSPMHSPTTTAATLPSSPSPPPLASPASPSSTTSAAAAAAAAQFMLFQQRQQQLQQHQQQLQQQQKQAILARQKPRIQKVIPGRGPVDGGMEITLLGSGFFPGMIPTFDGIPAQGVQYYGPETMICRLPPRKFPGTVVVKAQSPLSALAVSAVAAGGSVGGLAAGGIGKDDGQSSELVRTMTQLFGGPSSVQGSSLFDDDVGALFEYEESNADRDLIALALQVLGMKMNGRVEPPQQVALRIMGTAAASNAIAGQGTAGQIGASSQGLLQLQQQQQLQLPTTQPQGLLGFGGLQSNLQSNGLVQQNQLQQQQQQQQQQSFQTSFPPASTSMVSGSLLSTSMLGFGSFLNSMGGSNGGSGL